MTIGTIGELDDLPAQARAELAALPLREAARGAILFRQGDSAPGFIIVLSGTIWVHLVGRSGREMLLYEVESGQTCMQTTLCLLADQPYSGEGIARTDVRFVVVPRPLFATLIGTSAGFRSFVFRAFGERLRDVVHLLESVAFVRVEARLAAELLRRSRADGIVLATHQELAVAIGSAREVVSRRLESWDRSGVVRLERGQIAILDYNALRDHADPAAVT